MFGWSRSVKYKPETKSLGCDDSARKLQNAEGITRVEKKPLFGKERLQTLSLPDLAGVFLFQFPMETWLSIGKDSWKLRNMRPLARNS